MDSEICTMLGSLSLRGWSFEQEQAAKAKQVNLAPCDALHWLNMLLINDTFAAARR